METIGLFSGVLLFSLVCLLPEVRAHSCQNNVINKLFFFTRGRDLNDNAQTCVNGIIELLN